ncbi:MAG TPA: T9SS type A sorting domain-containing protein, partial [Patescibacteria group bacterium]|nr:T9SS type A sorting domain-containing protein [Patescibacteria group bacterium]
CGARKDAGNQYTCSWECPNGYGSDWDQSIVSDPIPFTGELTFSYHLRATTEPDGDYVTVEYDAGDGNWTEIASYDGCLDTLGTHTLMLSQAATKLRFHFVSDGAFDCRDDHYTCGAVSVDSLVVTDYAGLIDYEDFETSSIGAKESDSDENGIYWRSDIKTPYGLYSALMSNLIDRDPINDNLTAQVIFWWGSPNPSTGYPGLYDTPFCQGPGGIKAPCQDEMILSPLIDLARYSSASDEVQDMLLPAGKKDFFLKYEVYADLPLKNLVFYGWSVRNVVAGCPGQWLDRNYLQYSPYAGYQYMVEDISDLVGTDPIQIGMNVVDMCDIWYIYGDCAAHTPAPYFDNISIECTPSACPKWYYRPIDLFQDNFPYNPNELESFVRADMANDTQTSDTPQIITGDSVVVQCASPQGGGLAENEYGKRVYMHVRVAYIGDPLNPKPSLSGLALQGNYGRYDHIEAGWTVIQGEPARIQGHNPAKDKYMFDLNDNLFTRGYMIEYYFKAYDNAVHSSTLPKEAESGAYFEFTCLPTLASDILYVDDFDGRGSLKGAAQLFLDTSFEAVLPEDVVPDRYDVNGPSFMASNGPGSRASDLHLLAAYTTIIWDSGNLRYATISDSDAGDKSQDCAILIAWLYQSVNPVNLWICGDNIANDLSERAVQGSWDAEALLNMCGVALKHGSYYEMTGGFSTGGIISPEVVSAATGPFFHGGDPVTFTAYGAGSPVNSFDVLEPVLDGVPALKYPDWQTEEQYAGIITDGVNNQGAALKTVWIGVSYLYIRDIIYGAPNDRDRSCNLAATAEAPIARFQIMKDVFDFFETSTNPDITDDTPPKVYTYYLDQNYPNPFNPATTIKFGLKETGPVTLKIYNVAGQLVATLVDEVMEAGHYTRHWDVRNSRGSRVASGIYFYRLQTEGFTASKKLILLR